MNGGFEFELVQPPDTQQILPELRAVSDQWMREKKTREKAFSLGAFSDGYVSSHPAAIARKDGRIVALANAWLSGKHEEIEADRMRFTVDAPPGMMRYILVEMMRWAREQGFNWFNLGMASHSGLSLHRGAPIWNQLAVTMRGYGERFCNFQGIRESKQWLHPEWEPQFPASPGRVARPVILANIASLISGDVQGVVRK